jgi:uridine kinase
MSAADFIIPRARDNAVAIDMLARDIERRVAENAAARSVLHPPPQSQPQHAAAH